MSIKKMFKTLLLAGIMAAGFNFSCMAGETEMIPMDQLPITEDPQGLEDGEKYIQNFGGDVADDEGFSYQAFRYLSAGVNEVVYKAIQLQGVDVSYHQGIINWAQVKASGMDFAMIRVGYRGYGGGTINADTQFETNIQNALAAGMKVGIYFFSQAITEQEALEEAAYTINVINRYKITYPVVFDWETAEGYRTYSAGITGAKMNSIATTFCNAIANAGYIPMVYSNTTDFNNRYIYSDIASRFYIWYARYPARYGGSIWYCEGDPLPNNLKYNMWQYMSDGRVPGINGNCDVNVTFLDFGNPIIRQNVNLTADTGNIFIDNTSYTITGNLAGYTYSDFSGCFSRFNVTINGTAAASAPGAVIKTGDRLVFSPKASNEDLNHTNYTLVVRGDTNGDGLVNVVDMEKVQKHVLGLDSLNGVYFNAARLSGSSSLSVMDMEKIQKNILGLGNL